MKKWREDSDDASALRVTLAVALLFVVAVLFAFPFVGAPTEQTDVRNGEGQTSNFSATSTPPCTDNTWRPTNLSNAPPARSGHTAVWTGSEMIVWGGNVGSGYTSTGARYNPMTDAWTPTSTTNAPNPRANHTAVWTGSEMIIWGGQSGSNTGGRYNPVTNTWTPLNTLNAPGPRSNHTAVWTGTEMIVWGGDTGIGCCPEGCCAVNTGARYNPMTDTWTMTDALNAPVARSGHTAVWTGDEMVVWGGGGGGNTGGRYNPLTNSWSPTSTVNAPAHQIGPAAVWTGTEMIVWGGATGSNVGGRYNPVTDSWTSTSALNAPTGRYLHTAIWDGHEMIVWGGFLPPNVFMTGGRYNPVNDSWTATATAAAPVGRIYHHAVWTGNEMIVWGGAEDVDVSPTPTSAPDPLQNKPALRRSATTTTSASDSMIDQPSGVTLSNTGGRYCVQLSATPTPSPPMPTPTPTASATPSATPNLPPCSGKLGLFSIANFDNVTPPNLPSGWAAMNSVGGAPTWVTSNSGSLSPVADTAPNSAFAPAPDTISDNRLESQTISLFETFGVYLIFRHNFDLQSGFDGGVLEISFQGGPYQDVTSNGGQFVSGGYNSTISTSSSNPLAGRAAWSGTSGGFVTTIVELPGQSWNEPFKLRWRLGTDNSISGEGWRVDSIDLRYCHFMGTPPGTPTPSPKPTPTVTPTPSPNCSPSIEGFNNIATLPPSWYMQNNSQPGPGTTSWFQGNSDVFPAQGGAATSYIGANFNNGTGTSTLSNWLLTPPVSLQNGVVLTFWTRTVDAPAFPDRLQVRMSTNGSSQNVGTTATSVGDFTNLLLDINPTYTTTGYPNIWTQFSVTVNGIPSPTLGRLAFRYFVENGGPNGTNSDYIGIDTFNISGVPCPCMTPSFSNSAPIMIPGSGTSGISAPYPSTITVTGVASPIRKVEVTLRGLNHTSPRDIDVLLVGPHGQTAIIMSDAGSYAPAALDVFLMDYPEGVPNFFQAYPLPNGGPMFKDNYLPSNYASCEEGNVDTFPAPAPIPSGAVSLSTFNAADPNGTWSLYVVDDKEGNVGSFSGGWDLKIFTASCPQATPIGTATPTPPTHFEITAPASVDPGVPFHFAVTTNRQVGAIHFTSSDPLAVLPNDSSLPAGTETFTATLNQISSLETITVTDTGNFHTTGISNCIVTGSSTPTPTPTATPTPTGTPNGKIVFTMYTQPIGTPDEANYELVVVDSNGTNKHQLTSSGTDRPSHTAASWAPDNTKLVYIWSSLFMPPVHHYLHSLILPGNDLNLGIETNSKEGVDPAWSPDGTKIAYGGDAITLANADGSNPTELVPFGEHPAWSPDQTKIAFDDHFSLWVVGAFGSNLTQLTTLHSINAAWSNDGSKIAFSSIRDGNLNIFVVNADGSNPVGLTTDSADDDWPTWSPDSNEIAFASTRDGFSQIYVMNADGSNQHRISDLTRRESQPNWQRLSVLPTPTPTPTATPTSTPEPITRALNLSTRLNVQTGNNVGIGGFIITGITPRQVLLRGIGPSLVGVGQPLADPILELHGEGGFVTVTNNNWRDNQEAEIIATGIPPSNDLESAIVATLDPGAYTAVLSGNNSGTGVGLVEIYDLSQGNDSKLGNISTRAFVNTGSDIVIAGFILGGGTNDDRILVRGIGPSLAGAGVPNALANPTLELRDGEGTLVAANDDWQNGPPTSLPPSDPLESAIETTLSPGAYTALLFGVSNGTGVGLVEVYDLATP